MFGHNPRKPIILNAWFQLWNMETDLWWCEHQHLVFVWSCTYSEWLNYCQWLNGHFRYPGTSYGPAVVSKRCNFSRRFAHTHSQKCSVLVWGARKCTSASLASTIAQVKYHWTTVVSVREQGEKQIPSIISQATRRKVVQYSSRDYSEFTRVCSKKDTSCVTGKWWPNSILIKKCVSFMALSIIFVHPLYMLPS